MKKLYALLTVILISLASQAQLYDPLSRNIEYFQTGYFDAVIGIINLSSDTLFLDCRKVQINSTTGTDISLCANGECHIGCPEFAELRPVLPQDTGALRFHMVIPSWSDTAEIVYEVFDRNKPVSYDTLTYRINCGMVAGIKDIALPQLLVYPNPAKGLVRVVNAEASVEVLDAAGRLVLSSSEKLLDLTGLPGGSYTILSGTARCRLILVE